MTRIVAVLLLLFLNISHAANLACEKEYTMGIGASWPPYTMFNGNYFYGLDIEIAEAVFEEVGLCLKFIRVPSSGMGMDEFKQAKIDVIPSASFNKERAKIAFYSSAYRRERMRLFSTKYYPPILNLTELFAAKYTFTANLGAYYGDEVSQILKIKWYQAQFKNLSSIKLRTDLLKSGEVDFSIEDEICGLYYSSLAGIDDLKMHSYIVHDNAIYFMLNRLTFDEQTVQKINQAIVRLEPKIKLIKEKYMSVINLKKAQ